ncbi:neurexin-2-like [Corapipo altera]|uniref:neurexin-2-like n=1 Tax=Corapipo altera TaxID=415028 RepID=UPI000FD68558|nr:neurexin-2-like [Corapipo altera]
MGAAGLRLRASARKVTDGEWCHVDVQRDGRKGEGPGTTPPRPWPAGTATCWTWARSCTWGGSPRAGPAPPRPPSSGPRGCASASWAACGTCSWTGGAATCGRCWGPGGPRGSPRSAPATPPGCARAAPVATGGPVARAGTASCATVAAPGTWGRAARQRPRC